MSEIIEFLFSQYSSYSDSFIFLEFFAVLMNIVSVIYAKQNNILVYPTGLIGTGIFNSEFSVGLPSRSYVII